MSKIEVNEIVNQSGDNDSGIDLTTNDQIGFKIANASKWTLNSSGNLFPASTSQGIVLGATSDTSANRLEDYEEGTWTPSLGGNTTYHNQAGKYTKIGRTVHASAVIQANSLGTGSTTTVSGFPFTHVSAGGGNMNGSVGFFYFLAVNVISLELYFSNSVTSTAFKGLTSASNISSSNLAIFGDGARVDFSVTYETS